MENSSYRNSSPNSFFFPIMKFSRKKKNPFNYDEINSVLFIMNSELSCVKCFYGKCVLQIDLLTWAFWDSVSERMDAGHLLSEVPGAFVICQFLAPYPQAFPGHTRLGALGAELWNLYCFENGYSVHSFIWAIPSDTGSKGQGAGGTLWSYSN